MKFLRGNFFPVLGLFGLVLFLPVAIWLAGQAWRIFSQAAATPANIVVDVSREEGALPRPWTGVAQGGELNQEKNGILSIASYGPNLGKLGIKYIRLDHVLNRPRAEVRKELSMIRSVGATPVIALSYFPKDVSENDVAYPHNWPGWHTAVAGVVREISGEFDGVYYEVWNEPDGKTFGGWSPQGYLELYRRTVKAVETVQNVKGYKIGGPSLADPNNKKWLGKFLDGVEKEGLRLDFVSWHRYHRDPKVFIKDLEMVEGLLAGRPSLFNAEKIITEWGTDPGVNAIHAGVYDAAHFVAVARQMVGRIDLATKFEVRDGVWTNDFLRGVREIKDGEGLGVYTSSGTPKPMEAAMALMNRMAGQKVNLTGEGSSVWGLAAKDGDMLRIMLSNFEKSLSKIEEVPVTINNLTPGTYRLNKTIQNSYFPFGREETQTVVINGPFSFNQLMLSNSVVLLEVKSSP